MNDTKRKLINFLRSPNGDEMKSISPSSYQELEDYVLKTPDKDLANIIAVKVPVLSKHGNFYRLVPL